MTRRRNALSHAGSILLLALGSACASPTPDAGPRAAGPYIASRPETFEDRVIGAGHCVDFVKAAAGAPRTTAWRAASCPLIGSRRSGGEAVRHERSEGASDVLGMN